MEPKGSGLQRILQDVRRTRQPDFYHLTRDRLWVADLVSDEDGGTALELQCFGPDGKECLRRVLYRMEPECPDPYFWFTDNAVMLFHTPEDPADRDEDKAITLRWFPLDTLAQQVWRVEPEQLPGQLSGVIGHQSRGEVLSVQGTFLKGDDARTACVEFDLAHRRISAGKPCPLGVPPEM